MGIIIRKISKSELNKSLDIMHKAYEPIAIKFGLTEDNCPYRGNASYPYELLCENYNNGLIMYGLFVNDDLVGLISLKVVNEKSLKIKDLVVLPTHQHNGYGKQLLEYAEVVADNNSCTKVILGMIYENDVLRSWYINNGYSLTETINYEKAPFTVGMMEKEINL